MLSTLSLIPRGLTEGQTPPSPAPGAACRCEGEVGWPVFLGVDSGSPDSMSREPMAGPLSGFQLAETSCAEDDMAKPYNVAATRQIVM